MENMQYTLREEYRYFAFISYSHKDMAWAKWLQRKLENYRLPALIRKKYAGLPQKIAPVFRDQTDLAGPVLEDALQRELERSQYLIVICSPSSALSGYVNGEVEYFLSLGRKKQIIPFIVAGEPFSDDPSRECFPPGIRSITPELLGIDAREHGKKDGFSRLVATLLRLPADEVVMRERRRERLRKTIAAAVAAVMLIVLAGAWWYNTEHSAYYNAYTSSHEIPVGLYELSRAEREKATDCFRITTLRGRVVRLETVNSQGVVIDPLFTSSATEYPIMEYLYDDDGALIAVVQRDEAGQEVSRKTMTHTADGRIIVEFKSTDSGEAMGLAADIADSLLNNSRSKSMINRQDNTYDDQGRIIRSMYYWYNTFHPVCDSNGVYGKVYTYHDSGLIATISNLDQDGNILNCRYGWSTIVLEYDSGGNLISECYYAADGSKAIAENGCHGKQWIYDFDGNVREQICINPEGQLCNADSGIARQVAEVDSHGFITSVRSFNSQGAAAVNEDGTHERRYSYDESGRMCHVVLLDREGQPVVDPDMGYSSILRIYDEDGNDLEQWFYGPQGEVLWVFKYTYENGKETGTVTEDGNGNPILCYLGFHAGKYDYDRFGYQCREAFYDEDGNPILTGDGYASREFEHDEYGNIVEMRFYGTDGQPCIGLSGYAIARYTYSDGLLTNSQYFGTGGEVILTRNGHHECRITYNEIGICTRLEYRDTDGKLVMTGNGYAALEQACDAAGNVTEIRYFGAENQPILYQGTHHRKCWQFDSVNNITHVWYYGTDGKLILQDGGYAASEQDYNEYGDSIAMRFYGVDNEPVLQNGEYHEVRYQRDHHRNLTHISYYGTDGRLILVDGFATMEIDRDVYGNALSTRYFGTKNEPILLDGEYHEVRQEYDAQGHSTRKAYYDPDGMLIMLSRGYAAIEYDYDENGNIIAQRFFGESNEPILRYGECHEVRQEFDVQGYISRNAYYGPDGNLIMLSSGYAAIEYDYDENGNIIAQRFFGESNEPILRYGVCHEVRREMDAQGNETKTSYHGLDGELVIVDDSYAVIERDYDENGNIIAERFFGKSNEPILRHGEYHIICYEYDTRGNTTRIAIYGTDGEMILGQYGYAAEEYDYDANGNITAIRYFGAKNEPVLYRGAHEYRWTYDEAGNDASFSAYDTQGNLIYHETYDP